MKHHDEEPLTLVAQAEGLGVALPFAAAEQILDYERLLIDRGVKLGVVSSGDVDRVRKRHILDSLRAVAAVRTGDRDAYDLGSGGGLPGVVIAAALPGFMVSLVETRQLRAAFLELVVERLGLANAAVLPARIEELSEPVDVCLARALAPPAQSWLLARPLLRDGGRLVYFAGDRSNAELLVPEDARIETLESPVLESAGPLVIMTRQ